VRAPGLQRQAETTVVAVSGLKPPFCLMVQLKVQLHGVCFFPFLELEVFEVQLADVSDSELANTTPIL